ncbi:serine hydrolase [Candidatus Chrysopegis kryptomonas]|uniref:beta-lactamase n=1 Tax=Candidatus Chryseopegocella kryptomonas TaxID=1633643 RepID=A0A0P1MZL5_9BACT|nr:serine hydrolase [Candidatus Chrysopegis kryptomonas]CUT01558.1 beta-lactamase class A [Candidatus Chrysopegis kryptomonas]
MKKIIFPLIAIFSIAISQPENLEILHKKTFEKIKFIADTSNGVIGVAIKNLATGETFLINENLLFPQGSAIKIPILVEVLKQANEGKFKLTDKIKIEKKYQVGGSGVLKEFGDGLSELSIYDLAVLMITVSDNTATNILIDLVGMENVNKTLEKLGFKNTKLQRKMIRPDASARGEENLSTPFEAMKFMEMLYKGQIVSKEISEQAIKILKKEKEANLNKYLPQNIEIANKPGGIEGVTCEWGIVFLPRHPYVIIIMSNYNLTSAGETIAQISKIAYEHFWRTSLSTKYGTRVPIELLK